MYKETEWKQVKILSWYSLPWLSFESASSCIFTGHSNSNWTNLLPLMARVWSNSIIITRNFCHTVWYIRRGMILWEVLLGEITHYQTHYLRIFPIPSSKFLCPSHTVRNGTAHLSLSYFEGQCKEGMYPHQLV